MLLYGVSWLLLKLVEPAVSEIIYINRRNTLYSF